MRPSDWASTWQAVRVEGVQATVNGPAFVIATNSGRISVTPREARALAAALALIIPEENP